MPGEKLRVTAFAGRDSKRDSRIAAANRARSSLRPAMVKALAATTALFSCLGLNPSAAADVASLPGLFPSVGTLEVIQLAIFAGAMGAAFLSAIYLIRQRAAMTSANSGLRTRVAELSANVRRYDALLNFRDQRVVFWPDDAKQAELVGTLPAEAGAPEDRSMFLAFGRWLSPQSAANLDQAIAELRNRRRPFDIVVETQTGAPLDVQGRYGPAYTLVRFISSGGAQQAQARLRLENQKLTAEYGDLLGLLNRLETPFWVRGGDGRLKWVNKAYAEAVEASDPETAVRDARELLGTRAREEISQHHRSNPTYTDNVSTVIKGNRHILAVTNHVGSSGSAGLGADISEVQEMRDRLKRADQNHSETLNRLTTAVAIFDANQKLRFYNQAFMRLWDFDAAFLDSAPDNNLLLDRLRSQGQIGERPDWRRWKDSVLAAYRAVESHEDLWHLPDSRTLRVVANPEANGGVTWVYENLTEKFDLESRYQTEVRVRGETLDNLAEGVAVFGLDGKLKLFNPAFLTLWGMQNGSVVLDTHISVIRAHGDAYAKDSPWAQLMADITGFQEARRDRTGQSELKDGSVLRYGVIPLPNGQVMVTFIDMTDSVNVERALQEKNEALQHADQLKNDFVQHVSYELRSPLTNIRGFAELLEMPATGPLNERQGEYVRHIGSSSQVLSTIIDDILDLATVDAGIMRLDISEVPVKATIDAAAGLIAERMQEHSIGLQVDMAAAPPSFHGDEVRVRQVLYNLLSNAVNYAPPDSTVTLSCHEVEHGLEFSVHDDGPGMSDEVKGVVFSRFESRANGGRRRGAGLGLSIVKSFVELHGGSVRIDTHPGKGTTIVCFFPSPPDGGIREAAE